MGNWIIFILFAAGIVIIIKGGDWFVESSVWLAKITGIPNILIGATIVSIATTFPELLVSTIATYQQHYDVAIGNVIGSVVCNTGLVLGLTAVMSPSSINRKNFSLKSFFMLISCSILFYLSSDGVITKTEGNLLIVLFLFYVLLNVWEFKTKEKTAVFEDQRFKPDKKSVKRNVLKFIFGSIFITLGARLLVNNGVALANLLGIPEQVISVTLIAFGTSLPELVTAISSIIKGHHGISVGNILGANILDMLMVIGVSSKIGKQGLVLGYQNVTVGIDTYHVSQTLFLDLPMALLMMIVLTGVAFFTKKVSQPLGMSILLLYVAYLILLIQFFT